MRWDRGVIVGALLAALAVIAWLVWPGDRLVSSGERVPAREDAAPPPPAPLAASGREARPATATGPRVPNARTVSGGAASTRLAGGEPTLEDVIAAEGLSVGGVLQGVVLGLDGAAANIELVPVREPRFVPGPDGTAVPQELPPAPATRRLEVASDGTFRLDDELPLGPWELTVSSPGRASIVTRVQGAVDGATILVPTLAYGRATISGQVWKRDGTVAASARVTATATVDLDTVAHGGDPHYPAKTDATGAYVVRGLRPGYYRVCAEFDGIPGEGPPTCVPAIRAGDAYVQVVDLGSPVRRARRAGTLRWRSGVPVTRVRARLHWSSDADGVEPVELSPDGSFVVWLKPGRYTVRIDASIDRFCAWPIGPIDVVRPEPLVDDLIIRGSDLAGRIVPTDPDVPIGDRKVRRVDLTRTIDGSETTISMPPDRVGSFEFVAVPAGRYHVTGHPGKLRTLTGEPVVVDVLAGQDPPTLELVEAD